MSASVRPHRRTPTRFPRPWDSPGKILEWVAISFSNAWKWKVKVKSLGHVWLLATSWTAAYQAPPSMGFSKQECWSGVPLPSPMCHLSVIYSTYSFLSTQRRSFQPVCYIGATTFMVASGDLQNTQESVGLQPARSVNTQGQNCRWMSIHISTHSQDWMVQTAPSKPHLVVLPRVRAEPQINSAFPESH